MNKKFLRNTLWCVILITTITLIRTINTMSTYDDGDPKGVNITSLRNV